MNKHKEKHKNDVKENEKTCWATCPKPWNGGQKQAFWAGKIGGGQKWTPLYFRQWGIFCKQSEKQNL